MRSLGHHWAAGDGQLAMGVRLGHPEHTILGIKQNSTSGTKQLQIRKIECKLLQEFLSKTSKLTSQNQQTCFAHTKKGS